MRIRIQPYTEDLTSSVREFNARLRAAGIDDPVGLPQTTDPLLLPRRAGQQFYEECFVAVDEATVRGGYILYHQLFSVRGDVAPVANCAMPVSEGVIDRNYGLVAIQLLVHALRRQPLLFGFGMAGENSAMTRLVKAMSWDVWSVPFGFKVLNGTRFLKNIQLLRRSRCAALFADLAARCGLGNLAAGVCNTLLGRKERRAVRVDTVDRFSSWADELWDAARTRYSVLSVRDSAVLNALYGGRSDYARLRISENGRLLGWVVVEINASNRRRFGDMEVGYILDCLALPSDAATVTRAAADWLARNGAELIVSNQSHPAWWAALKEAGFVRGPSTFVFASAPQLTLLLQASDLNRSGMHFTRGTGDLPLLAMRHHTQPSYAHWYLGASHARRATSH